jgi:hypothetical protein
MADATAIHPSTLATEPHEYRECVRPQTLGDPTQRPHEVILPG